MADPGQSIFSDPFTPSQDPQQPLSTGQERAAPSLFTQPGADDKLTAAMRSATDVTPDQAARIFKLQTRTGLPAEIIRRNLDQVEAQAARKDFNAEDFRKNSPLLASWLASDQYHAALVQDDLTSMSSLDRLLRVARQVGGDVSAGLVSGFGRGIGGAVLQGSELLDTVRGKVTAFMRGSAMNQTLLQANAGQESAVTTGARAEVDAAGALAERLQPFPSPMGAGNIDLYAQPVVENPDGTHSTVDSFSVNIDGKEILLPTVLPDGRHVSQDEAVKEYEKTGRMLGVFETPEAATAYAKQLHEDYAAGRYAERPGFIEQHLHAAVEGIAQMVPALAAGFIGGPGAGLAVLGATTAGSSYAEARSQGVDVATAARYANVEGAIQVGISFIPLRLVLGDVAAHTPFLTKLAHQIASDVPLFQIQTALDHLNAWATLPANKDRTAAEYFKEYPSEAAGALVTAVAMAGITSTTAHAAGQFFRKLNDVASESETFKRSPDKAAEFVAHAVENTGAETVYLPLDTFTTYWQGKGVDPADKAAELTGKADAYATAKQSGEDLAVPLARYASQVAATEHGPFFAAEAKLSPEQMNSREAEAFAKQTQEVAQPTETKEIRNPEWVAWNGRMDARARMVSAEHPDWTTNRIYLDALEFAGPEPLKFIQEAAQPPQDEAATPEPPKATQVLTERLQAAGMRAEEAQTNAAVVGSFFDTFVGQRAGLDPEAIFEKRNPQVVSSEKPLDSIPLTGQTPGRAEAVSQPASPEAGPGSANAGSEQPRADEVGAVQGTGDGRGSPHSELSPFANPRPSDLGEVFTHRPVEETASRLTPAVRRELDHMLAEMDYLPGQRRSFTGGAVASYIERAGVFDDVLAFSPVNKRGKEAAKQARGTGEQIASAVQSILSSGAIDSNLAEGALRVAEARSVNDFSNLSHLTMPRPWADVAPPELIESLSAAIDAGLESDTTEPLGSADTSFDFSQNERGAVHFGPDGQAVISLFAAKDKSTFAHESAHLYLEVMGDVVDALKGQEAASLSESQRGVLSDYEKILGFVGAESRQGIENTHHETFADAWTTYLSEGKAPSAALQGVFARFATWLTALYRRIARPGVTLTPEIRGVFDRMLASDQAIAQAQGEAGGVPLFTDAARAGMTDAGFAAYRDKLVTASAIAREELAQRIIREQQREQNTERKAAREEIRGQVAADLAEEPVYRAEAAIRYGTHPDGTPLVEGSTPTPLKLAKADLVGRYTPEELTVLRRRGLYSAEGGDTADVVAEMLGYPNGDALVRALIEAPSLTAAIEAETARQMTAAHGDPLDAVQLRELAQRAVTGEHREAIIRAELKALSKGMQAATIPPADVLRAMAEQHIGGTRVRDLKPGAFLMAAQRASQKAFDLLSTNEDRAGAVQAKQQELVALARYREAIKAKDFTESARDYLGPYLEKSVTRERIGKAGGDYLDQLDALRERFDFRRATNIALDKRASLRDFLDAERARGHELAVPAAVQNEAYRQHYRDLTVEELRQVFDAAKSIEHWARFKNRLLQQQAKRDLATLGQEGAASIVEHSKGARPVQFEPRLPGVEGKRNREGWRLSHRPLQAILRQMDGYQDGFLFDHVWRPAHEARNAQNEMTQEARKVWSTAYDARFKGRERELYAQSSVPGTNLVMSTVARLVTAFNYGNEGNRERLMSAGIGQFGPMSEPTIQAILRTLTAEDWTFVRAMVDQVNSYRDRIGTMHKRVTGVEPTWVEPAPFATVHGEQPGWYWPIKYENRVSPAPGVEAGFAETVAKASYMRFATDDGHTELRREDPKLAMRADLGVIGEHLEQVIHDLTHREMLIDAGRLLGRRDIQEAIYAHYGDQGYDELKASFRDVAIGTTPAPNWYRVIAPVRRNAVLARLAWNFTTIVKHVTNLTTGMVRVGTPEVLNAIPQWLGSAKDAEGSAGWIDANSSLMARRWNHRMQETASIASAIELKRGKYSVAIRDAVSGLGIDPDLSHRFADSYLYGIHKVIQMAEIPTFLAQYRKAGGGADHARAIASAESAVLDAFGGGDTLDLAGVQRSFGGKLFTTFMSYGLSLHRMNYEIFHRDTTIARKAVDATLLNVVPVVLIGSMLAVAHKKKELAWELTSEAFGQTMGQFVFTRELSAALTHRDYSGPAALSPIGTAGRVIYDTAQGLKSESPTKLKTAAKEGLELAGQFYGVPVYQIERSAEGILALMEGKTKDPWAAVFGVPKKP